jgi:hypothetical protein
MEEDLWIYAAALGEVFYLMLNEIDGQGLTISCDEPLEERVASLVRHKAALARRYVGKLPRLDS